MSILQEEISHNYNDKIKVNILTLDSENYKSSKLLLTFGIILKVLEVYIFLHNMQIMEVENLFFFLNKKLAFGML